MYDIVIKDGFLIDGSGKPGQRGDIGILGDRIEEIGECPVNQGRKVIWARGKVVAPGFIDIHSHSDFTILAHPGAESKVYQGVTTELVGQCGISGAPMMGEFRARKKDGLSDLGISVNWSTLNEYFCRLGEVQPIVNIATLVGQGNLRGAVIGYINRRPLKDEIKQMKKLLLQSLEMGAFGLSTGLIYPPGVYSSTQELIELVKLVAQTDGIYATHIRNEGNELIESVKEAIYIAERTGVSLQISHLKTWGRRNWKKLSSIFQIIDDSRKKGLNVHADRYPYTASSTDLDVLLPSWAWEGGKEEELRRLADPDSQKRMAEDILSQNPEADFWDKIMISTVKNNKNRLLEGKTLAEISIQRKCTPWEVLFQILKEEELKVSANFFFMSEENLSQILSQDYVLIGTDSAARSVSGILRKGKPHPRGFGTYPRILCRWTGSGKLFSSETAIHKMTGLPAKKIGLNGRGLIQKGYFADLVIFDPSTIKDQADFDNPFQYPTGIEYVIINGIEVISNGKLTGKRPGRVLRKQG